MTEVKENEIVCSFTDIRNCWEMKNPVHLDGNWCDIKNEMIKQAAQCKNYNSDVIYDINLIQDKINNAEEFICHELFYECGVHSTLELRSGEEDEKLTEMIKHSTNLFCILQIRFEKCPKSDINLYERDWTLKMRKFIGEELNETKI